MSKKIYLPLLAIVTIGAAFFVWRSRTIPSPSTTVNNSNIPIKTQEQTGKHLVEIFYLPHAPAREVVKKVEPILTQYPDYEVKEYDLFDAKNKDIIAQHNLTEHLPVAIFIDGKTDFTVNGQTITLKNFPKSDSFIPSFAGNWDYGDLQTILNDNNK